MPPLPRDAVHLVRDAASDNTIARIQDFLRWQVHGRFRDDAVVTVHRRLRRAARIERVNPHPFRRRPRLDLVAVRVLRISNEPLDLHKLRHRPHDHPNPPDNTETTPPDMLTA